MPQNRRQTLGLFLRARREALSPEHAGLITVPTRRRTPGLRREETAQLCGISTTWYTWLEQGRDVTCSPATLDRIANALRLTPTERHYLFTLAEFRDPRADTSHPTPPQSLLTLPHQIGSPAYVLDPLWNVISANKDARTLFTDWLNSPDPNQLHYVFLNPQAQTLLSDWPDRAQRLVAEFRADTARLAPTSALQTLTDTLKAQSPDFLHFWQNQRVLPREGGPRSFNHPTRGICHYEQTTLTPPAHPGYKLVILLPCAENRHQS